MCVIPDSSFLGKSCIFPEAFGVIFLQANIAWLISIEGMVTGRKEYSGYISFATIQHGSNSESYSDRSANTQGILVSLLNPYYCTCLWKEDS